MLFNSYPFLLAFLPGAVAVYAIINRYPRLRIPCLLAFSLLFYGYWNPAFVLLLIGSILVNWLAARQFAATRNSAVITAAIVLNLAVLGLFKYADFFTGSVAALGGFSIGRLDFVLPLGISFFTFHHIMYLADLRRGRAEATSLDRYALYICFFPQAVAGPLARWSEVGRQFGRDAFAPDWEQRCALGITFIMIGLIEKVAFGDPIGQILDPIYQAAASAPLHDGSAWLALGFGFQIFFDFAGYSDIAIGIGLLFGIQLPFNFNAPFRATSILVFWQRWHMTLSRFLRDYVFMPLADMRIAGTQAYRGAVCRCDHADHGAVRPVARRRLELRPVGHDARRGHRVRARLAARSPVAADGCRLGGDNRILPAQRRGVPHRDPGRGLEHLFRPRHASRCQDVEQGLDRGARNAAGDRSAGDAGIERADQFASAGVGSRRPWPGRRRAPGPARRQQVV